MSRPSAAHRGDEVRGISHQEGSPRTPSRGDAVMDAVDDGAEDFEIVHGTDELQHLLPEFVLVGFGNIGGNGTGNASNAAERTRIIHSSGSAKIGEIGIIARIANIQVHLDVDQQVSRGQRLALNRDVEHGSDRAPSAAAGEQIEPSTRARPVRRLEGGNHRIHRPGEAG